MSPLRALPLVSPFAAPIWYVEETASTMEEARALLEAGCPPGTLVMADSQSAGRGRRVERVWKDRRGQSLLATLILAPELARLPGLSLRVGLALARACEDFGAERGLSLDLAVKWPNDLMLGERKLGGILCEAGPKALLVGFGLNVLAGSIPAGLEERAVALLAGGAGPSGGQELGGKPSLEQGIGLEQGTGQKPGPSRADPRLRLLELALLRLAEVLQEEGWREALLARLWKLGEEVSLLPGGPDSRPPLRGRLEGVDEEGGIQLRGVSGLVETHYSAELSLR